MNFIQFLGYYFESLFVFISILLFFAWIFKMLYLLTTFNKPEWKEAIKLFIIYMFIVAPITFYFCDLIIHY